MKTNITILTAIALLVAFSLNAQVAINTDGSAPDGSAMLEIESTSGGILIPRMTQAQRNSISNPATGLLIWQTDNTPGFYYNAGTPGSPNWTSFGSTEDWTTTGNAGTNPSTNFLGTTDAQSLAIYSNNSERMRVLSDGRIAVNSTAPFGVSTFYSLASGDDDAVDASAAGDGDALYAQQTGTGRGMMSYTNGGGDAIWAYNGGTAGSGLYARANAAGDFGVWSYNANSSGTGLISSGNGESGSYLTAGTGIAGAGADGVYGKGKDSDGTGIIGVGNDGDSVFTVTGGSGGAFTGAYGVYAKVDNNSTGIGVVGVGHNVGTFSTTTTGSGGAFTGQQGVYGKGIAHNGTGVIGLGSNASGYYTYTNGSGVAGTGTYVGVYGVADNSTGAGIYGYNANSSGWAGYFAGPVRLGTSNTQTHYFTGTLRAHDNSDHYIIPNSDNDGWVGTSSNSWDQMYTRRLNGGNPMRGQTKNVIPFNENHLAFEIVMDDLDKMTLAFFRFNDEEINYNPESPSKYRPANSIGIFLDDTPDYIQDSRFSSIDFFALNAFTLAGVKYNREKIKEIEKNISDFGVEQLTGKSVRVNFSQEFRAKNSQPVVTTTAMNAEADLYISDVNSAGFTVHTTADSPVTFSWIAMAKVTEAESMNEAAMDEYRRQHDLVVPESTKEMMRNLGYEYEANERSIEESEMKGAAIKHTPKQINSVMEVPQETETKNEKVDIKKEVGNDNEDN